MNSWCKCNMAGRWAAKTPTDHSHIAALCLHPAYPVVLDADKEQCLKQAAKEVIKESKHYCGASVATPAKAKSSFQITSVTVGSSRLSNDGGEDSADDLDESHTDDNSRVTDNETPSFSEDTMSKEDAFYGAVAGQAPTTAPVIPTSAEYGLAIVPEEAKEIVSAERDSSLDVTVVQRPEDVPRSDSTRSCTVDMSPDKISQPPVSTPTRPVRHERFKVVKIESEEPFRRGRWTCMDYFDHSVHMPVTSPFPSCCPWASPRPSVATVAQPLPASSKTTTAAQQRGQMQPTASRSQFGNQNAQRPRQPQQQTSQYQAPATAAKQPLTNTFATKSAFTKVPLTTAYQQQTYAQQPQQAQFSSQQAAPQQQTYISSQVSAQYQNVQPQYVQAPHKVPTNLPGVPLYNRQVQTPAQGSPVSAPLGYAQVSTSQTYTGQTSTQYQPSASTQAYSTSTPQPAQAQAHYVSATPRVTAVPIPSPAPYLAQTSASTGQPQSQQPTYAGATSTSVTQTSTGQSVVQPSVSQQTIASATSQSATSVNQTTTGSVTSVQGQQVSGATSRTTPSTSTVNTTEHGPSRFIATVSPTYPDGKAIPPSTTASVATSITSVNTAHTAIITTDEDSTSTANTVAIDNKIEQAMDLVKSHLMFAVREEVEVLKEKIAELMDRINQLEYENGLLKTHATPETLAQVSALQAVMSGTTPMQHRPIAQTGGGGSQQ